MTSRLHTYIRAFLSLKFKERTPRALCMCFSLAEMLCKSNNHLACIIRETSSDVSYHCHYIESIFIGKICKSHTRNFISCEFY